MQKVTPRLSLLGFVLLYTRTGMRATGTLAKKSYLADKCRTKAGLFVIKTATSKHYRYLQKLKASCDNMGIVKHGNVVNRPCPEKQVQADVISLMKKMIPGLLYKLEYEHVFGHLYDIFWWGQHTIVQKLNLLCNFLAKRSLMTAIVNQDYIGSSFPFCTHM
jgi:hypothetical protein